MDGLAREMGVEPRLIKSLRRGLGPRDLVALAQLTRLIRQVRPDIVHTHAAKAGALGRLACILCGRASPRVQVHTFHGHVLSEYFSPPASALFRRIERALARRTSTLVAVSEEVRDDLIRWRIAPRQKIEVIPLGLDLGRFRVSQDQVQRARAELRQQLGVPMRAEVVVLVARLVPIKRVDRFLRIAGRLASDTEAFFVVVGDGELGPELKCSPEARALGSRLIWAGFLSDMPAVMAAADVVVLTSDNEGTPVSLIEAHAAGRPVVSTRVGGVASVVADGHTGYVVPTSDEAGFARRVAMLLHDRTLAGEFGRAGREHVIDRFAIDRLVGDIDRLYRRLLLVT